MVGWTRVPPSSPTANSGTAANSVRYIICLLSVESCFGSPIGLLPRSRKRQLQWVKDDLRSVFAFTACETSWAKIRASQKSKKAEGSQRVDVLAVGRAYSRTASLIRHPVSGVRR